MVIAVCTDSGQDYEMIGKAIKSYGEQKKYLLIPRRFAGQEYQREQKSCWYPITFFALDDIMNQELAILARGLSEASQFVWIGQDKRFGMAAYRTWTANFLLRPVKEEEIWESLDRCFHRLERSGIIPLWKDTISGYKEWVVSDYILRGR